MMKHRISAFLLAVLLAVTAAGCSAQEPEDSAGLPESSAGTAVRSEAFYPAEAGYTDYDGSPIQGWSGWNADGTFTFQNRNTLTTLSRENQVLETITLPEEALPGSEYSLDRSDDYILALSNPGKMNESYGAVYYTTAERSALPTSLSLTGRGIRSGNTPAARSMPMTKTIRRSVCCPVLKERRLPRSMGSAAQCPSTGWTDIPPFSIVIPSLSSMTLQPIPSRSWTI